MGTPFTITGTLNYPPDTGQPVYEQPISLAGSFDSMVPGMVLKFTGSGTVNVPFGSISMLKGYLIRLDSGTGVDPVLVRFNGAGEDGQTEISAGGGVACISPNPDAGIESIDIVHSTAGTVHVWLFG